MSPKEQAHSSHTSLLGHQALRPEAQSDKIEDQPVIPAKTIQKAKLAPHLLTSRDVLQFQRAIGNRAVNRLLTGAQFPHQQSATTQPSDTGLQRSTGPAIGTNVSGVQAHSDTPVHQVHESLQAKVFATGQELLVHKQPHVIQQKSDQSDTIIQRQPANAQITGLTHLVQLVGGSLFNGPEGDEVTDQTRLIVETSDRIRSRRGPNQESFHNYDQRSRPLYRWYRVLDVNGRDVRGDNLYIREDTFTLHQQDRPIVSTNLTRENRHRRTRQSHKLIRLEAWYNTNRTIDRTGHMIMYDYERNTYREYAISQDSPSVPLHIFGGVFTDDPPPPSVRYTNVITNQPDEASPQGLRAYERPERSQLKHMKGQTRTKEKVPRFNAVLKCDLLVTQREYAIMLEMFMLRLAVGHYNFVYEARTERNPYATRCLTMVEDIALIRQIVTRQGYADEVLQSFIDGATIEARHVTRENL